MTSAPDRIAVPSREDDVAREAAQVIGGPLGRYAVPLGRGWRRVAAGAAAATAIPLALGVTERAPCIDGGWTTPDQFWHMCFSDLPATFHDTNLGAGIGALFAGGPQAPTPAQPPLTAMVMSALGGLVPDGSAVSRDRTYFGFWAVLIAVAVALVAWWTAGATRRTPARAAHVAFAPVVALATFVGPDALGVALASAAMYLWSRSRLVWSGVLFGLAISARSYPVLLLLACLFVALRAGRLRQWLVTATAAAVAFAVPLAGLAVTNPDAAVRSYAAWAQAGAGFGSPWVIGQVNGIPLTGVAVTVLAVLGWVAAVAVGAFLALASPRRPPVAEVGLVMVAVVMLTGKSMPVQSALWLVPLVALVGLAWRDHLIWAGAEALHFGAVWLYLAGISAPDRGLPAGWYSLFLLVRLVAIAWLVRQTWRASRDRAPANLDPLEADQLAGPLAGRSDTLVIRVV